MNNVTKRNNSIFSVPQALSQSRNLEELLKDILDMTLKVFKVDAGLIRIFDEKSRELVIRTHKGISLKRLNKKDFRRKYGEGKSWECIQLGRPIIAERKAANAKYIEKPLEKEVSLLVPLKSKNQLVGCIALFAHAPDYFKKEKLPLFSCIGNQIGVAIDNARLFNKVEERTHALTTLYAISQTVSKSLDLDQVLNDALDKVIEVLKVDSCLIRLLEEDTQELVIRAHKGFSSQEIEKAVARRKFGQGSAWECVKLGKTLVKKKSLSVKPSSFRNKIGVAVSVSIPLMSKDRLMGTMSVYQRSLRDFSASEMELFNSIGNQIGIAIDNANLFTQVEKRTQALTILYAISQTVSKSLDLDKLLDNAMGKVMELFKSHSIQIWLLDDEAQELVFTAQKGLTAGELKMLPDRRKPGESAASLSIKSGKAMVFQDLLTDHRVAGKRGLAMQIGHRSLVSFPLYAKDNLLGVIAMTAREPRTYADEEIQVFTSIGHQIGTAIENAKLHEQVLKTQKRLQKAADELESKVEERTTELSRSNKRLQEEIKEREKTAAKLRKTYKDLKSTQSQLVQSAKLSSIGELAAGVAHELNQPLMVIRSTVQFVQRGFEKNSLKAEEITEHLERVEKNTKRMMNIVDHLRTFSRQSQGHFMDVDVNRVLEDSFLMVGEQLRLRNIQVKMELSADLPKVLGDVNQLEQVFLNLISNARDAMEEKRKNSISETEEELMLKVTTGVTEADGKHIEILVKDSGGGISAEAQSKIFDPFYTTKELGKGTGLGLSISYGIIKDHHGEIGLLETSQNGTTFRIKLPAYRTASSDLESAA